MIAAPARAAVANEAEANASIAHRPPGDGGQGAGWLESPTALAQVNGPWWTQATPIPLSTEAAARRGAEPSLLAIALLTDIAEQVQAEQAAADRPALLDEAPLRQATAATPSAVAVHQRGEASWYGAAFAGRPTASGEPFDPRALTAAHRDLPLGSRVLVTAADGRSVVVRVNDRGPYQPGSNGALDHPSRVIDLSRGAAQQLGMVEAGVAEVRLQVLSRP